MYNRVRHPTFSSPRIKLNSRKLTICKKTGVWLFPTDETRALPNRQRVPIITTTTQRKPIGLFEILRPFTHKTQKKQRATTQLSFQSLQNYPPFAPKVVLAFGLHPIRFKPQTQTFSQFTHKHTTHTQHVHAATTANDHDLVVALAIGAFQVLCRRQASVGTFHQTRTKAAQSQS